MVKNILNDTGFGGIIDCGYRKVDHALITALVERWRPETHTFHLTVGEATVTLQDVNVLWGLPIEGEPVSGVDFSFKLNELIERCELLLGFTPSNTDIVGGRIKLVCLLNQLENDFPENPNALQCTQHARLIILYLCGGTLFPDSTNSKVPLLYLNNLIDLSVSSRYSWGSAVLACLYRNLCKATHPDAVEITGPVYLLQLWALERWFKNLSYRDSPSHVLKAYRSQLQSLRDEQFAWTPYDSIMERLPFICRNGEASWTCECFLILWEVVEPHHSSRVMRQFGLLQNIPNPIPLTMNQHHTIHNLNRGGKLNKDWLRHHQQYVSSWNQRLTNTIDGQHVPTPTVSDDYMRWYRSRTVLYITNPGSEEVNPRGFQNDGGAYQLMMDGMVQIYQSTRQFIGDNPETQNQFQRIQDTVSQVMGLAHEGHRLELPTHLTTQSVNSMGNENVSQVVRRRGRRRNTRGAGRNNEDTADEAGPSGFHNFEAGTSRFQNFEVGGTSNFQDEPNVFVGPESPYIPTFNSPNSLADSYSEFGVTPQHHMDYTVTPNVVPTYGQQSSFDYFAEDLSMYEQPRYSDVSPIPLNLSLGMMPSQEDVNENNQHRRRQTRPPPCGTGHRLSRHDH
ncbi:hypothetical protein E3N88_38103 [Mikania micrantha]|uniref:Aminotransferase-like plant mobile domain-containing protein n=1 Tax=Mikania micrantha TaxID=192012 RepID=A0A5N6LT20_9ASTR|nr:hypothetical protein E3N88_38103 [Mikania micrantha]